MKCKECQKKIGFYTAMNNINFICDICYIAKERIIIEERMKVEAMNNILIEERIKKLKQKYKVK